MQDVAVSALGIVQRFTEPLRLHDWSNEVSPNKSDKPRDLIGHLPRHRWALVALDRAPRDRNDSESDAEASVDVATLERRPRFDRASTRRTAWSIGSASFGSASGASTAVARANGRTALDLPREAPAMRFAFVAAEKARHR